MIKKIFFVIGGLILFLVLAVVLLTLVAPTQFAVEREVVINKPQAEVFQYLKYVKNQENWTLWSKKDPGMKHEYKGVDGTVGFIASWDSEHPEVGSGEQEITRIVEGERIESEVRFKTPFESTSPAYLVTESVSADKTRVKWGFSGSMPRPWNIMMLFMDMEKEAGKEFEEGLSSLKSLLENRSG